ncbi:MAG: hypothetical protein L0Z54_04025, partial [Thermoplasmata archaeon]|nr:hypothetical protein [Thermoplasmata archaeon]
MRLAIALLLALLMVPAAAARVYDGPTTIGSAVVWEDDILELERTITVAPNGSLGMRNVTVWPAGGFNWTAHYGLRPLFIAMGPVSAIDCTLSGNGSFSIISTEVGATIEGSVLVDAVYGVLSWSGDLNISGTTFMDDGYGAYALHGNLTVIGSALERVDHPLTTEDVDVVIDGATITDSATYMCKFHSSTVDVDGFVGNGAGEGIILRGTSGTVSASLTNVSAAWCDNGSCSDYPATGAPVCVDMGELTLVGSTITSSDMGVGAYLATVHLDGVHLRGLRAGVYAYRSNGSISNTTFEDCSVGIEGNGVDIAMSGNAFVNTSIQLIEWWRVGVRVRDPYGNVVRGASVMMTDALGGTVAAETSAFGDVDLIFVGRRTTNGSEEQLDPWTLSVSAGG